MSETPPPGPPPGSSAGPPPGWYTDPTGQWRWWDGVRWGAPAPPGGTYGTGGTDPRTMAMLANLLALFTGFLGPLVIYLTAGKQDPFVRHHSSEALNFQLTLLIGVFASVLLMLVIIGFFLLLGLLVCMYVFPIMAAVKSYRGEWWRYPLTIRFVSGAA